jgi:hypothetical protein
VPNYNPFTPDYKPRQTHQDWARILGWTLFYWPKGSQRENLVSYFFKPIDRAQGG